MDELLVFVCLCIGDQSEYFKYTLFNGLSSGYSNIDENDRSLLVWQMSGQQDAAMLREETAFVEALTKSTFNKLYNV